MHFVAKGGIRETPGAPAADRKLMPPEYLGKSLGSAAIEYDKEPKYTSGKFIYGTVYGSGRYYRKCKQYLGAGDVFESESGTRRNDGRSPHSGCYWSTSWPRCPRVTRSHSNVLGKT